MVNGAMDQKKLMRIAARVAVGNGISVLNTPQQVDIPDLGPVEVIITKADRVSENYWRNVSGTINGIHASTSGGKGSKPVDQIGTGLAPAIGSGPNDFRPIDAFSIAISQILANTGAEVPEFPEIENGMFQPPPIEAEQEDHE